MALTVNKVNYKTSMYLNMQGIVKVRNLTLQVCSLWVRYSAEKYQSFLMLNLNLTII